MLGRVGHVERVQDRRQRPDRLARWLLQPAVNDEQSVRLEQPQVGLEGLGGEGVVLGQREGARGDGLVAIGQREHDHVLGLVQSLDSGPDLLAQERDARVVGQARPVGQVVLQCFGHELVGLDHGHPSAAAGQRGQDLGATAGAEDDHVGIGPQPVGHRRGHVLEQGRVGPGALRDRQQRSRIDHQSGLRWQLAEIAQAQALCRVDGRAAHHVDAG